MLDKEAKCPCGHTGDAQADSGRPLRAVVEEGLRYVFAKDESVAPYHVRDLSVGDPNRADPLESYSWPDLREMIYEDRTAQ